MVTYIIPIITDVFISRFLYTLYKYSEPRSFNVILVDQCKERVRPEVWEYIKDKVQLYMHPHRNLGYAKAMNEGIIHGLRWGSDLICVSNDDIEIMDSRWMKGIEDTFALDPERIVGVVPMTPRVAGWGYGVKYDPEVLPYKEEYTKEDYDFLLNGDFSQQVLNIKLPSTFPTQMKGNVIDGCNFTMVYFKPWGLKEFGLLDERFFPGSGEDYDYLARVYRADKRLVCTQYSWVWHHWSKSKDLFASGELEDKYYKNQPYWNNMGDLWKPSDNEGHPHDTWGKYVNSEGRKVPLKRVEEIRVEPI